MAQAPRIMEALARYVREHLNAAEHPEAVIAVVERAAFAEMVDELLHRWDEMRSIGAYVGRSVGNLLDNGCRPETQQPDCI